ncbi:MAG: tRNA (guanosine(37)-N1)-methyltransferase TrmD [Parcubacteria group bacterium]|nr:tRNA (guanosine(37)-N1)-methyltransferase TrmD [Parcubacteria group bacterium]
MTFDIITIFPNIFDSYLKESILARAQKNGLVEINIHNLRDYTSDTHRTVDDSPYGGGVGMVMMAEPLYRAINDIRAAPRNDTRIILLTPRGKRFTQRDAQRLTQYDQIILIAGRYEGIDERVAEFVDEQISIGDFVLSGGELPALAVVEAASRLIPGVLGKDESSREESFSDENSSEYPQYTRPEIFITDDKKELKVPEILLSGNHAEIAKWRKSKRKQPTKRPQPPS